MTQVEVEVAERFVEKDRVFTARGEWLSPEEGVMVGEPDRDGLVTVEISEPLPALCKHLGISDGSPATCWEDQDYPLRFEGSIPNVPELVCLHCSLYGGNDFYSPREEGEGERIDEHGYIEIVPV